MNTHPGPWIVAGDLNVEIEPVVDRSKLPWRKRERLFEAEIMVDTVDFQVYNDSSSTYFHLGTESINEYTLGQDVMVLDWRVNEGVSMTGHQYIWFRFIPREKATTERNIPLATNENKYNNLISLTPTLEEVTSIEELNHYVVHTTEWLQTAVSGSTELRKKRGGATWWTPALTALKKQVNQLATKCRRWTPASKREALETEFAKAKKTYREEMVRAREDEFRAFVINHHA